MSRHTTELKPPAVIRFAEAARRVKPWTPGLESVEQHDDGLDLHTRLDLAIEAAASNALILLELRDEIRKNQEERII